MTTIDQTPGFFLHGWDEQNTPAAQAENRNVSPNFSSSNARGMRSRSPSA
jgi:hypothetical protein